MMFVLTTVPEGPEATRLADDGAVVGTLEELLERLDRGAVVAAILDEACSDETLMAANTALSAHGATSFLWVERCCLSTFARMLALDIDCLAPRGTRPKELRAMVDHYVATRRRLIAQRTSGASSEERALDNSGRSSAVRANAVPAFSGFEGFVGQGDWLDELCGILPRISQTSASVLVQGETGTGKELVARAIHRLSPRRHGPFLAINCGAIPETLIESELFGHEKGSFTGATTKKLGRFELADHGTLFLDEVAELSEAAQVKLLRALQEGIIDRVGGTEPKAVDVRIIAATNRSLDVEDGGALRADLLFRLQVLSIRLPPLRERLEDVLPLWTSFLEKERARTQAPPLFTHPSVSSALLAHRWPGNVRELQNAAVHAATLADEVIERRHLPASIAGTSEMSSEATPSIRVPGMSLKEIERIAILETLKSTNSIRAAAELLGISRRTIQYRLSEYREEGDELASAFDEGGAADETGTRGRPKILLAEDDADVRHALEALLVRAGYEVVALSSGGAVLQYLGGALLLDQWRGAPDVIVSDVRMPGMTGMQLLEGMHINGWKVPVVLMTAFADDSLRAQALALGAAAFLDKPLDVVQLERAVAAALEQVSESQPAGE